MRLQGLIIFLLISFTVNAQEFWVKTSFPDSVQVTTLYTAPNGYVFAGTVSNGIYRSVDSGENWIRLSPGSTVYNSYIYSIEYVPQYGKLFAGTNENGLFASTDFGNSWSKSESGLTNTIIYDITFDENRIYLGTRGGGVFESINGGQSWSQINVNLNNLYVTALSVKDGELFAGTEFGGAWKTINGKTSWVPINNGLADDNQQYQRIFDILFVEDIVYLVTLDNSPYRSENFGTTWVLFSPKGHSIYDLELNPEKDLFAASAFGVYKKEFVPDTSSGNGGGEEKNIHETFFEQAAPSILPFRFTSLTSDFNGYLYGGTDGDGIYKTLKVTSVSEKENIPLNYSLSRNYPNPFNPITKISYSVPQAGEVRLVVYDLLGREVNTLVNDYKNAGTYQVTFNAKDFPSGVYFYSIQAGSYTKTNKMVLLK